MPILSHPSFGPRVSLTYITTGALLDVWTAVWYYAFHDPANPLSDTAKFWLVGLFLTGLTLCVIGVLLGPIGQFARKAELPPPEAVKSEAMIQETGAATPQTVVPAAPASRAAPATNANQPGVAGGVTVATPTMRNS